MSKNKSTEATIAIALAVLAVLTYSNFRKQQYADEQVQQGQQIASKYVDKWQSEDARKYPGLSQVKVMQKTAEEKSAQTLASAGNADNREELAADTFFGFYFMRTRQHVTYCRQRGVDISGFISAFTAAHRAVLSKAESIFVRSQRDPEVFWQMIQPQASQLEDQLMSALASDLRVSPDQVCQYLARHSQQMATYDHMPAAAEQVLTGQ